MTVLNQDSQYRHDDGTEIMDIGMYEVGGEDRSDFRVFNVSVDQYHRAEVLQQTGAVDIACNLERVVHGAMSTDSDRYATLIIMQWFFQPKGPARISEATIELLFEGNSHDSDDIEVENISFLDTYSVMPTNQEETITKGGDVTFGVEQFINSNATGKWEKTVGTTTSHAITLSGGKRLVNNRPPNRIATWTLSENQSQPAGIPASLRIALLVSRRDREKFSCKVAFTCKTDLKTAARRFFRKIPKDDPIIFQPNPYEKGTRPNKNVAYGEEELESVNLNDLCDVTFRTIIANGEKTWN